jgi:hypothetical protein
MVDLIIGVDCATQANKVGLARAYKQGSQFCVQEATVCSNARTPIEIVENWLSPGHSALIALDAPLGWPAAMARSLSTHVAGQPIAVPPNLLFRRLTDRVIAQRTGKTPLDVGADRIARTAHWALFFLDELRRSISEAIPLAWSVPLSERIMALEVYPAATLLMHGASLRGYKHTDGVAERQSILEIVGRCVDCTRVLSDVPLSVDALDAIACILAGVDFLDGKAAPPDEFAVAQREGWIWVRQAQVGTDVRLRTGE